MADEPMFKDCPECGRTHPTGFQVCDCGHRFDPDREEIGTYQRVQEEKARTEVEIKSASAVRIVDIRLTFSNVFGLTVQFWLASLIVGAVVGVVYVVVLFVQTYS